VRKHLMTAVGLVVGGTLVSAPSEAAPYRDKHGNIAQLALTTPLVGAPLNGGIHFTVPYLASDSDGGKTGHYQITSQTSPGRGATDDFVFRVLVTDDRTQKGAELVIRSHPSTAPLGPVLRLLDCRTLTCTEDKRIENEVWGAFVIRDRTDIATYPIELLDAHASLQLLDPAILALLPNAAAGTGNWAEVMQHHQITLQEAKFRAEIDSLGASQSDTLTSRMITSVAANVGGTTLIQDHAAIPHHALTFLTDHDGLIETLASRLSSNYSWSNYTFPFGRMPAWLINDDLSHTSGNFDDLPQYWERGQATNALNNAGCFHPFPEDVWVPTLGNGGVNIGQYVCAASAPAADGFVDRRCEQPNDYFAPSNVHGGGGLDSDMEDVWHDPIHPFMGGEQLLPSTTAGTASFWPFHTLASSMVLAHWRYAQTRNMPAPTSNVDPASLIDVNILVDTSSSFADDLPNFKNEVPALIDDLAAQYSGIKFSLGSFQDYPISPFGSAASGDVAYERLVDFNDQNDPGNNAGVVKNAIASLDTRFGDDGPQSQLAALYQTVTGYGETIAAPFANASIPPGQQVHFRQQATKIILLFTDAGFHNPGDAGDLPYPGPTFAQTVSAIQAADPPMVIGISSGGGGVADLQAMASATGAVAPAGGADCDSDGVVDVAAGAPLVCATSATSDGIGDVLTEVINVAIEEAKTKDTDGDGLTDLKDNCYTVANANQADLDGDSLGDACDPDDDGDGIEDAVDNCLVTSNNDQLESDGDGIGDACDSDDDDDGVADPQDPCPLLPTPNVITGTSGNNQLLGTSGNDLIWGLGGDDVIDGRGGNDCLVGGPGSDSVLGGDGNDILIGGTANDELDGQAGDDSLSGDDGNDVLRGGLGDDRVDGGVGNDEIHGDEGDHDEGDDDDDDAGPGGADTLKGGDGEDKLFGEGGNDLLEGGPGQDALYGMQGDDEVMGGTGDDRVSGGAGNDTASGNGGKDRVSGGAGNDILDGGIGNDVLHGNAGDDFLYGGFTMPMDGMPMDVDHCFGGSGQNTLVLCSEPGHQEDDDMADQQAHDHSVHALFPPPAAAPPPACAYRSYPPKSGEPLHRALVLGMAGLALAGIVRKRRGCPRSSH
jgi:Ca2+-binding RTX toxin-like protein